MIYIYIYIYTYIAYNIILYISYLIIADLLDRASIELMSSRVIIV